MKRCLCLLLSVVYFIFVCPVHAVEPEVSYIIEEIAAFDAASMKNLKDLSLPALIEEMTNVELPIFTL